MEKISLITLNSPFAVTLGKKRKPNGCLAWRAWDIKLGGAHSLGQARWELNQSYLLSSLPWLPMVLRSCLLSLDS